MAQDQHTNGFFPPYFVEVSLACALVAMPLACGATALLATSEQTSTDHAEEQVIETVGELAETGLIVPIPEVSVVDDEDLAHDIVVKGATDTGSEKDLVAFERTAEAFEDTGHRVGAIIVDLGTGREVSYGADEPFYPASSIKGPYVISLYEKYVDTGFVSSKEIKRYVEPTIVDSDNDAYRALRDLCGSQVFADWAVECGAIEAGTDEYERFSTRYYPEITTRQLALMWEHAFTYLNGGSTGAQELMGYFERRVESPIRAGVATSDLTITKAGWYPLDAGEEYAATVDAGIVLDGTHGYVVAIMTDAPGELDTLAELVPGIFSACEAIE